MPYTPEQLSDLQSIRDLTMRAARSVDRLDPDGLRSVYWPDATDEHGPSFNGNAWEYVDVAMASHQRWAPSIHTLPNQLIELDSDTSARAETYCVAYLFAVDSPTLYQWFGRYLDRFEKRGDEWRIIHRVCVHEGSRVDDPLVPMPFPTEQFRSGTFDRPSNGRRIGP